MKGQVIKRGYSRYDTKEIHHTENVKVRRMPRFRISSEHLSPNKMKEVGKKRREGHPLRSVKGISMGRYFP